MHYHAIVAQLAAQEHVTVIAHGNSMTPRIRSGQKITVSPLSRPPQKDDIVLAKVRGRYYFHKVTAIRNGQYQISNNHGHINGWTKQIYGLVTKIGG